MNVSSMKVPIKVDTRLSMWIMIFPTLLLFGCGEVLNEYYISNHTDMSFKARLTPRYQDTVELVSGYLVVDMQKSVRSTLEQSVPFKQDGDVVEFEIPPNTTMFLGFSRGGQDLFTHLELKSDSQQIVMGNDDYRNYFTVHDRFIGAIVQVFDVK